MHDIIVSAEAGPKSDDPNEQIASGMGIDGQ